MSLLSKTRTPGERLTEVTIDLRPRKTCGFFRAGKKGANPNHGQSEIPYPAKQNDFLMLVKIVLIAAGEIFYVR